MRGRCEFLAVVLGRSTEEATNGDILYLPLPWTAQDPLTSAIMLSGHHRQYRSAVCPAIPHKDPMTCLGLDLHGPYDDCPDPQCLSMNGIRLLVSYWAWHWHCVTVDGQLHLLCILTRREAVYMNEERYRSALLPRSAFLDHAPILPSGE